ncbi:MAG TPA: MBL fold metallo-hydrolase [Thermoanaerobaculia bacterium]|nr:MBL fold metallo-hydrolase [Thermoanaerobaculia bacterium]
MLHLVLSISAVVAAATGSPDASARKVVQTAMTRMGGADALRRFDALSLETVGYRNLLEQSERPEGPWIPAIERTTEAWDIPHGRWSETTQQVVAEMDFTMRTVVDGSIAARRFGERWIPAGPADVDAAREWMSLSPQAVMREAADASDLRLEADREFQGVPHRVVAWGSDERARRLLVNAETGFPTAIEELRAYPEDRFWQVWGDVPTRIAWSYWDIIPGGATPVIYPRQWDVERGGRPWRALTITKIEPGSVAGDSFDVPTDARTASAESASRSLDAPRLGDPKRPASELAADVVYVPGSWGIALVRQDDGVVVIEAPISAGYSAAVLDEAKRRFPDTPVKAVVSTSDSWPHFGGIREYAARGIPIYVLDHNVPQIRRALDAPHRFHPDALARSPRAAVLRPVSARTSLGSGPNRIELVPVRGETGERMMLAYLPGSKVLYASDLFQAGRDGPPEYAWEVADTARREKLDVTTVFAMHSDPTPWGKLIELTAPPAPR